MQIQHNIFNYNSFERLVTADITRLPLHKNNNDVFTKQTPVDNCDKKKKSAFWKNFFTAATFAITALYIAHRSNLFNPIRREAKRIIKNQSLHTKVGELVERSCENWDDVCTKATKNLLTKTIADTKTPKNTVQIAQNILDDDKIFNDLYKKVAVALKDEPLDEAKNIADKTLYKNGYVSDILDSLLRKTEKILSEKKMNKQPYKNIHDEVIGKLFNPNSEQVSIVDETLESIIQKRSSSAVDGFIQDMIINSK